MITKDVEVIKLDAVLNIPVTGAVYSVVKNLFLQKVESVANPKELLTRLMDNQDELTVDESIYKFLLDFLKECEVSAKENKQTETMTLNIEEKGDEIPTESPSES